MVNLRKKVDSELASKILRIVPMPQAFLFFTDVGEYTGEFAFCLRGFYEKLDEVPLGSIEFHHERKDFEKWVKETLGDQDLVAAMSKISRSTAGKELRRTIKKTVENQLDNLEEATLKRISGIGPEWARKLKASGVHSVEELVKHTPEDLTELVGVPEKIASRWIGYADKVL